jgi:hypothetical protein
VWKFLHIVSMFVSVTLMFAASIFFDMLRRGGELRALRTFGPAIKRFENVGVALFFVGVGFGLINAWRVGFGLTARWLISAYVLSGLIVLIGGGIHAPIEGRFVEAVMRGETEEPTPELQAMLKSPATTILSLISAALYGGIIYVMVEKPFA